MYNGYVAMLRCSGNFWSLK